MIAAVLAIVAACWLPPVDAPIVDGFRPPPCSYCAGNRGIEYAPTPGTLVRAVHGGVVSFAGSVAGTRYVIVDHGDGLRATYGKLSSMLVRRGQAVAVGAQLGTTSSAFFFGLRRGDQYIDPTPFLGALRARPHLVPLDGNRRRPGRPPRLTCPQPAGGTEPIRR